MTNNLTKESGNSLEAFGQTLRRLRTERGISQQKLADDFDLQRTTITNYESGKSFPNLEVFASIVKYFGVPSDALLGFIDNSIDAVPGKKPQPDVAEGVPITSHLLNTKAAMFPQRPGRITRITQLETRRAILLEMAEDISIEIQELRSADLSAPE